MTEEQKQTLATLLEAGVPLADIAKEMGMAFGTLKIRMAESGLKIKRVLVEESR